HNASGTPLPRVSPGPRCKHHPSPYAPHPGQVESAAGRRAATRTLKARTRRSRYRKPPRISLLLFALKDRALWIVDSLDTVGRRQFPRLLRARIPERRKRVLVVLVARVLEHRPLDRVHRHFNRPRPSPRLWVVNRVGMNDRVVSRSGEPLGQMELR